MPDQGYVMNYLKENPLKAAAGVLTIVGILITSVWAAESRYNQMPQIGTLQHEMMFDRQQRLEDQVFVLEMKKANHTASDVDRALLERYKARLQKMK